MKKIISLVLFVFTIASYSQEKTISQTDTNSSTSTERLRKNVTIGKWTTISQESKQNGRASSIGNYATIGLVSGISTPSSNFSDNAFAENGTYFELSGAYYFSKFGIGMSVGQILSPTNKNFSSSINSVDIPTTNTTQNWKQFYYGIGPEYKAQFGNFSATFSTKIGLQSVKSINLESNYTNGETPIAILKVKSDKNTSLSYFSTGLKFGYNLSSNFNLYATANYMTAFSNGITISKSKIADTNKNGIIDAEDLKFATGSATIDYEVSTKNIKLQTTNFGIGINYSFGTKKHGVGGQTHGQHNRGRSTGDPLPGMDITIEQGNPSGKTKRKRPGRTTYSNITLKRSQAKDSVNDGNNTARKGKRKAKKECLKNGGSF
ncbi:MAG: hypothetical protein QM495_11065, partial [Lutibacter sp.]|uniref:hypothetical protein n=1 Tax=Lutibacter sp. TaxID=1925666 RepID=UPI003857FF6D